MKTTKRVIAVLLAVLMLGGTLAFAEEAPVEDDIPSPELLASIYDPANYEYEYGFGAGQVGVRLKKTVTITEGYEALFPELEIESVRRIAASAFDSGRDERQLILLYLREQTTESVLEAIELLKSNPYVYYSSPNYYLPLATDDPVPAPPTPGDVTGDKSVTNADLILEARFLVHLVTFDETQLKAADYNQDGTVNNTDLVMIAREVVEG